MPLPVRSKYFVIHGLNGLCFLIFGFLYCFSLLGRFLFFTLIVLFAFEFVAITQRAASRFAGDEDITAVLSASVYRILQCVNAVFLPGASLHHLTSPFKRSFKMSSMPGRSQTLGNFATFSFISFNRSGSVKSL